MSLKIERDTFQQGVSRPASTVGSGALVPMQQPGAPLPGTSGRHPIAERVGTALTGGKQNAGTKGYLAVRLSPAGRGPSSPPSR